MTTANDELYSLLVPLNQERLILPRACVAEVVRYAPLQAEETAPAWFRGHIAWNGRQVPVISFEELAGLTPAEPGGRTRVAILNSHRRPARGRLLRRTDRGVSAARADESRGDAARRPAVLAGERPGDLPDPHDQRISADS